MDTPPPPIVAEIIARLTAAGWSVRKLREAGFGGKSAEILLGKLVGIPDLETAERALALLTPPRSLWHRGARRRR